MQYILNLFKYFWAKVLLTIPIGIFIVDEQHFIIIYALLLMVFIDSILGIWVSLKFRVFNSHRLRRISNKIAMYSLALASVWILACTSPSLFGWSFQAIGIFLILTELLSNFEKLSLLGLEIPTKLLSKLNTNFYNFYFGDEKEKEDAVNFILSKGEEGCSRINIVKNKKNV